MKTLPMFAVVLATTAVATAASTPATPEQLFSDHCASCHGADGKAHTPIGRKLHAKDLAESKLTEAEIVQQITNGRKDARGIERMPGFKEKLSPEEIVGVAAYVKSLRK